MNQQKDALVIQQLRMVYPNGLEALKGIDLSIQEGEFFALLGLNGAGKTTTINILTHLLLKTSGRIEVFGSNLDTEVEKVKTYIGVVPQEFNFNIFESVIDIVVNQGGYYGIPRQEAIVRATELLDLLGLGDKKNQLSRNLSGGMKRRLMIARALIHQPRLLILDEPTAGVDIELRKTMWSYLKSLNEQGITIILTTHYLEEAERLCDRVAIIDKGIVIRHTSIKSLLDQVDKEVFVLNLLKPLQKLPEEELSGIELKLIGEMKLEATLSRGKGLNTLFLFLTREGIEVLSMQTRENRLERLLLELINV